MRRFLILTLLSLSFIYCCAQEASENDTQAYELYLSKTFAQYYPFSALQRVYKYLYAYKKKVALKTDMYLLTIPKAVAKWETGNLPIRDMVYLLRLLW